jgi:hypothetical protein
MKIEIEINEKQIKMIRELLNLNEEISNKKCIEEFIIENTCVDEDGEEF